MNRIVRIPAVLPRCAAVLLLWVSPAAGAGVSGEDAALLQACEANAAALDPGGAGQCLARLETLLRLAQEDPGRGTLLLERLNALKDISDLLDMQTEASKLRHALAKRMFSDSPLSRLGLGPEQKKLLDWVKARKPEKYGLAAAALRSWEALSADERRWVELERRVDPDEWDGFSLMKKNDVMFGYAEREAEGLFRVPPVIDNAAVDEIKRRALSLWEDLGPATQEKLYQHIGRLRVLAAVREKSEEAAKADNAGVADLRREMEEVKGLSPEDQLARLSTFFDNKADLKGSGIHDLVTARRQSAAAEALTEKDKGTLALLIRTALMKELSGTVAGDRILEFYRRSGVQPVVKVAPLQMAYAQFDAQAGLIILSAGLTEEWLRSNRLTPAALLTSEKHIRELALLLSPTFIHEAAHQEQAFWLSANKLRDTGISDFEVETMSIEALYIMEKYKKDAAFSAMISSGTASRYLGEIAERAAQFKKDPVEFRKTVRCVYYPTLMSFETAASYILKPPAAMARTLPIFDDEDAGDEKPEKPGDDSLRGYGDLAKRFRDTAQWLAQAREAVIAGTSAKPAAKVPAL